MPDRNAHLRLAAIQQHIDEHRARIGRFRGLIAQVASRGGDPTMGERLLAGMENSLQTLEGVWRANGGQAHALDTRPIRPPLTAEVHRLEVRPRPARERDIAVRARTQATAVAA